MFSSLLQSSLVKELLALQHRLYRLAHLRNCHVNRLVMAISNLEARVA